MSGRFAGVGGLALWLTAALIASGCRHPACPALQPGHDMIIDWDTQPDSRLQAELTEIDTRLRHELGMQSDQAAAGLVDLRSGAVAMLHPDRIEYAASVPKIGILLAWFDLRPEQATQMSEETRHELGLMIKASSNEAATRFSTELGLTNIQEVLNRYGFYDAARGGGLWMGKHYGKGGQRIGDPVADHSHGATIRQLLRFYVLLYQDRLVSPEASRAMKEIFESPNIPHDQHKFVKGLEGRPVKILRKWGGWEDYRHDSALVLGEDRAYILVGLTHHPQGDDYLERLARETDEWLRRTGR